MFELRGRGEGEGGMTGKLGNNRDIGRVRKEVGEVRKIHFPMK